MPEVSKVLEAAFDDLEERRPSDAAAIWQKGNSIFEEEGMRRRTAASHALTLYHGHPRHSLGGQDTIFPEDIDPPGYNLVQAAVDTKTAHIVRNKVRPMFVTERGDSKLRKKAEGMQRATESILLKSGVYGKTGVAVCRDGQIFGAGGMKFYPDYNNSRVTGERILAHEVLVDPEEAKLGDPMQTWHVHSVDRRVLLERYRDNPEAIELIKTAKAVPYEMMNRPETGRTEIADRVLVIEYWRRPAKNVKLSSDEDRRKAFGRNEEGELDPKIDPGHDGKHLVCVEGGALFEEPWPFDYFPIAWFIPMKNSVGFWGRGIPETLAGAQWRINRLIDRIDKILDLHAVPRIFAQRGALATPKLTNGIGTIVETKMPPHQAVWVPQWNTVPTELFQRIEMLIRWAEKQIGLSEMSISAQKPPGVDHAPGMQHLQDTETIRHTPDFRAWEEFHTDAARIIVDCCRMLTQFGGVDLQLAWGNSKQLKRINWKEVDLDSERYHLRCWPTNLLPLTPGARKSMVIDLLNAGLITQQQALAMLDFPDIEAVMGDQTAAAEYIEAVLEKARAGDESAVPEPYMNLALAEQKTLDLLNRMGADGESEEAMDNVRMFWELILKLQERMAPPPQDMASPEVSPEPPPGGPPGPPGLPEGVAPPDVAAA